MPPSRHSSTSHHSSSHSSSHSSHSSSSHSSSSFRSNSSSVSHHSSTSYKSSFGSSYSGSYPRHQSTFTPTLTRPRLNQPQGYSTGTHGPAPREYHCKKHDYIYYSNSWVSNSNGQYYKKGYYDETGKWYDDILIKDNQTHEARFTCPYCDTEVRTNWISGAKPSCPNCSAQLQEIEEDEIVEVPVSRSSGCFRSKPFSFPRILFFVFLGMSLLQIGVSALLHLGGAIIPDSPAISVPVRNQSSYYVEELGRSCPWYDEYESYYDEPTDCYFWYNDEVDIPTWQYWYEGISSDFGDYGWMEYDEFEEKWYIEADYGEWIELPDTYDASDLWYIHETFS